MRWKSDNMLRVGTRRPYTLKVSLNDRKKTLLTGHYYVIKVTGIENGKIAGYTRYGKTDRPVVLEKYECNRRHVSIDDYAIVRVLHSDDDLVYCKALDIASRTVLPAELDLLTTVSEL